MDNTYVSLYTTTLTSTASSVTISPISGVYTDLVLVVSGTHTGSGLAGLRISSINGDGGANYSDTLLQGSGTAANSGRDVNETSMNLGLIGSSQSNSIFYFMNYSNSTTYKTVLSRGNEPSTYIRAGVGLWRNTAAITSFAISGVTFSVGTTFSLYGITAASVAAKATGGTIYSDETYWYHMFGASGTLVPTQNLTDVDFLVVAGGGGGASGGSNSGGGGGGAGGLRTSAGPSGGGASAQSKINLTSGVSYTMTVGAGGAAGDQGSSSSISGSGLTTISTVGGGFGKGYGVNQVGGSGGSGGGGYNGTSGVGGAGTANEGYAGGASTGSGAIAGAGGGAGGVGNGIAPATGVTGSGGIGGIGVLSPMVAGVPTYFAGGGGGLSSGDVNYAPAPGGLGGGGRGANSLTGTPGQDGVANTGGGGGGNLGVSPTTGKGGSGIIIVRYLKA